MKQKPSINRSWGKNRIAFMLTSLLIVILVITTIGLVYAVKNRSDKEIMSTEKLELENKISLPDEQPFDDDSSTDEDAAVEEELRRIDTEIKENQLDDSNTPSSAPSEIEMNYLL